DGLLEWYVFGKYLAVFVAVNLRGRCEDQPETQLLLQFEDVPCADDVRRPKRVVILFAVDSSELRGEMVDVIVGLLEGALQLPIRGNVRTKIVVAGLMLQVEAPHIVASSLQF